MAESALGDDLSGREIDVLRHASNGGSNKEGLNREPFSRSTHKYRSAQAALLTLFAMYRSTFLGEQTPGIFH